MGSHTDTGGMEFSHKALEPFALAPAFLCLASPTLSDTGAAAGWHLSPWSTSGPPACRKSGLVDSYEQRGCAVGAVYDYDPVADLAQLCFDLTGCGFRLRRRVVFWSERGAVQ